MKAPKYMIVEKKTVIKALRTEPLQAGRFFHFGYRQPDIEVLKSCKVCAVGAVLRKHLGAKKLVQLYEEKDGLGCDYVGKQICKGAYADRDVEAAKRLAEQKNYLGALSTYFEARYYDPACGEATSINKEDREELVAFVRKNFPTRFKVEL